MKNFFLTSLFIISVMGSMMSQSSDSEDPIDERFSDLIENSNTFKGYKVVDFDQLTSLQKETRTYIQELKSEIENSDQSLQNQKEELARLEAELAKVNSQLEAVKAEKDAINFLGMPLSKGSYKTLMWSIIGILILALAIFVFRFKKGQSTTLEARKRMQETEKELEAFRAKALEKEQKLGRMLQDERNRNANKAG